MSRHDHVSRGDEIVLYSRQVSCDATAATIAGELATGWPSDLSSVLLGMVGEIGNNAKHPYWMRHCAHAALTLDPADAKAVAEMLEVLTQAMRERGAT